MYDRAMRALAYASVALIACGKPEPMPPKRPNNELIVGEFERHPPDGTTAMRFRASGDYEVAKTKADLNGPPTAKGTYQLEGDQLTFTQQSGPCVEANAPVGVYKVVISKVGIHFSKVSDECGGARKLDGQTWWRIK